MPLNTSDANTPEGIGTCEENGEQSREFPPPTTTATSNTTRGANERFNLFDTLDIQQSSTYVANNIHIKFLNMNVSFLPTIASVFTVIKNRLKSEKTRLRALVEVIQRDKYPKFIAL